MPYVGVDPWRWQYFADVPCRDDVIIPIDDATAWSLYPKHRWIYNKLAICASQGLEHGPHGTLPRRYPVFSKPIYNLRGMGTGGRIIRTEAEYHRTMTPGHLWMPNFTGSHVSSDLALVAGEPRWRRHTTAKPGPGGTFDRWTVHAGARARLDDRLAAWIARHLRGFTGIVNFETIGGRIIECHLRMAEQWLDLNGPGWLRAVERLYRRHRWSFDWRPVEGYSVVLFAKHGRRWRVDREAAQALSRQPGISSIQITFEDDVDAEVHAMPPGGFRLAIVNCWDLAAGESVRRRLKSLFKGTAMRATGAR